MASSLSNTIAILSLQDRICPSSSPTVSSLTHSLPRYTQFSCQKEILGTALLPRNAPLSEPPCRQQQYRRLTIEAAKRVDKIKSLILSSTLKAQEGDIEKVAKLCEGIRQWALEVQKEKAVGLKQFECYVDLYDKNVFHFMEEYAGFLHMNDIWSSPEHVKFCDDVRPFLLEPIALAAYELRDGQVGHMLNPIGPKGEGGLDDATGQAGRGGEAYMKPKAKKRRGIEFELKSKAAAQEEEEEEASEKVEDNKWSLQKILSKVIGLNSEPAKEEEQWSLKSLFGGKK